MKERCSINFLPVHKCLWPPLLKISLVFTSTTHLFSLFHLSTSLYPLMSAPTAGFNKGPLFNLFPISLLRSGLAGGLDRSAGFHDSSTSGEPAVSDGCRAKPTGPCTSEEEGPPSPFHFSREGGGRWPGGCRGCIRPQQHHLVQPSEGFAFGLLERPKPLGR